MSQHDFSAVVAALEAAAAERRTALDLLIAASGRASRMADAQAREEPREEQSHGALPHDDGRLVEQRAELSHRVENRS